MNVAMVTMTRNDDCRFNQWVSLYKEYKEVLYLHIIVDNDSTPNYQKKLHDYFPNSVIIELGYNGGCTAAYNAGIRYALQDANVDAIALIGNDIKFLPEEIVKLYNFLYSDNRYGMVFPRVQNPTVGSETINSFGNMIGRYTFEMIDLDHGKKVSDMPDFRICDTGPGGCNLAKPSFYNSVGLQDEKLFMYSDEVDMGIRARKQGVLMAIMKNSEAWHLHIYETKTRTRNKHVAYLIARNKVYLSRKHYGYYTAIRAFSYWCIKGLKSAIACIIRKKGKDEVEYFFTMLRGAFDGFRGKMDDNSF